MDDTRWNSEPEPSLAIATSARRPRAIRRRLAETTDGRLLGVLSRREREVLALIVLGKTDRQIADDLFLSRITVSNHVSHILSKLNLPNRTAAAAYATANLMESLHLNPDTRAA